jgi:glutathionylspermidine synthase
MKREVIEERPNLKERLQERVFDHLENTFELPYWRDETFYSLHSTQIEEIEAATEELHTMCVKAADHVIRKGRLGEFGIPEAFHSYIRTTFDREDPSIYGRFDFSYDGKSPPKMLEYNADTPTSIYEASVLQWDWLQDRKSQNPERFPAATDQFNSLHEALVDTWKKVAEVYELPEIIHFTCMTDNLEDVLTTAYMEETAYQAGIKTHLFDIAHMGRTATDFVDDRNQVVQGVFKLYPWEFMFNEEYGVYTPQDRTGFIEPAWKSILSNKNLLPVLWELFPGHPNLLPTFKDAAALNGKPHVKKATLGREGASVTIVNGDEIIKSEGPYDKSGFIYQEFKPLPNFSGNFPVIGSWVIGGQARGMGIREDTSLITQNNSRFVPHVIMP